MVIRHVVIKRHAHSVDVERDWTSTQPLQLPVLWFSNYDKFRGGPHFFLVDQASNVTSKEMILEQIAVKNLHKGLRLIKFLWFTTLSAQKKHFIH